MADNGDTALPALSAALMRRLAATNRDGYVPPPLSRGHDTTNLTEQLQAQYDARTKAEAVVYASAARWTGLSLEPGDEVPIVRNGRVVNRHRREHFLSPVDRVLDAAQVRPFSVLKAERAQLAPLLKEMERVRKRLEQLDPVALQALDGSWDHGGRGFGKPVDVVHALGITQALPASLHAAMLNVRHRLEKIEAELSSLSSSEGRPPNRPQYEVARAFAQLYASITGKRPTCSVSGGGGPGAATKAMYSGEFAPALRDLFNAFGWETTDIRGPANAAIAEITVEFIRSFEPARNGLPGSILGSPR